MRATAHLLRHRIQCMRRKGVAPAPVLRYDLINGRPVMTAVTNAEESIMAWTTPTLVEICIGLEINGYLPAEF
jgi:coenzyme PQQ precursor peptide PqqA